MHFYKFNIGDYSSHTNHLSESEDLAYRRMLDYCYLNEIGLPETIEEIGRLIRMRTHSDCIANVLREFFYLENGSYKNKRVEIDLFDYHSKSDKAAESAKARWAKHKEITDANAMRTQCEGNAKQEPLTIKQETLNTIKPSTAKAIDIDFELFWNIYPKKAARQDAEKSWNKLNPNQQVFDLIKAHLSIAYLQTEKQFIPNASTYLNGKRWGDEIVRPNQPIQLSDINYGESGSL